ncbi:homogentisate 1,2-dioxygenase [Sphingomonas sp.]|uniref:homogentisate 1,2-dioxygenase n=1 Tax=Sphingomonas sp. TaxID=28214 RepID=UPI003CC57219
MLLPVLLQLQPAPAAAPCPATPVAAPAELVGWSPQTHVTATASPPAALPVGRGVLATLLPAASVNLAVPTLRPPAPGSSAAVFAFTVATAGRYRVALGESVWVDVAANGSAISSVAHGHGPACSPVRKMVDFDLRPGSYRLQIVGSEQQTLSLEIVRLAPAT